MRNDERATFEWWTLDNGKGLRSRTSHEGYINDWNFPIAGYDDIEELEEIDEWEAIEAWETRRRKP